MGYIVRGVGVEQKHSPQKRKDPHIMGLEVDYINFTIINKNQVLSTLTM